MHDPVMIEWRKCLTRIDRYGILPWREWLWEQDARWRAREHQQLKADNTALRAFINKWIDGGGRP
jgi:hypothetical protein